MKKITKTVALASLCLLLAGGVLVGIWMLRDGDWKTHWENGGFSLSWNFGSDTLRGYTVCEDGTLRFDASEVKKLDLSWYAGAVEIRTGAGGHVTLTESAKRTLDSDEKMCWKLEKGRLSVAAGQKRAGVWDPPEKMLIVTVPAGWVADELNCDLLSASLLAEGVRAKKLSADTMSGAVTLSDVEAGRISVDTASGDVALHLLSEDCKVEINSASGDVSLALAKTAKEQRVTIDTMSGDVRLQISGPVELDFDTLSGKITGEYIASQDKGPRITVNTASGDLIIEKTAD